MREEFIRWFEMGFFGGLGYIVINFLWSLIAGLFGKLKSK